MDEHEQCLAGTDVSLDIDDPMIDWRKVKERKWVVAGAWMQSCSHKMAKHEAVLCRTGLHRAGGDRRAGGGGEAEYSVGGGQSMRG